MARRYGAVAQQAFQFDEFRVDEAAQTRRDVDVTAGEFETHMGSLG